MADTLDTSTPIDPEILRRLAGLPPLVPATLATGREIPMRPLNVPRVPAGSGEAAAASTPAAPTLAMPSSGGLTPTDLDIARTDTGSSLTAGPARPALRPASLDLPGAPPDPNDPKYQLHGAKKVGIGILGGLAGLGGHLDVAASLNPYQRALEGYNRDVQAEKTNLAMQDTASQIAEREASARRQDAAANKPEGVDQELAAATINAINRGADPMQDPKVKNLIEVKNAGAGKDVAKVKEVRPDDQGNAIAVMEDGTTKPLGFKAGKEPAATTYEHATIEDPKKPGTPKEALFDRTKGQYLDPDSKQPIAGAKPYEKPDKEKTAGEDAFSRGLSESAVKDVTTARAADFRYRTMNDSYPKALKGDQQAMLNLLTNHIGMTLGLQKGARITKDILNEATKSAPWLSRIASKFDKQGYLSGVTLTADQMKSMMDLAVQQRGLAWQQARESAQQAGVEDKIQFPKDLAGQGALNADEARAYLQKAGGDKAKARDLAKQDGRTF
jgi:hypothetical protein